MSSRPAEVDLAAELGYWVKSKYSETLLQVKSSNFSLEIPEAAIDEI